MRRLIALAKSSARLKRSCVRFTGVLARTEERSRLSSCGPADTSWEKHLFRRRGKLARASLEEPSISSGLDREQLTGTR